MGDGEINALGGKQGAEGVEVVVVFGDDLAKTAVGHAVGRLEAFEAAKGFAGDGGGAHWHRGRGADRGGLALELGVGRERWAREGIGLAEDRGGGLFEIMDAHEQLLALEEEAVDLDLLIGAHQFRRGGTTKYTKDTKRRRSGRWPTEDTETEEPKIGCVGFISCVSWSPRLGRT